MALKSYNFDQKVSQPLPHAACKYDLFQLAPTICPTLPCHSIKEEKIEKKLPHARNSRRCRREPRAKTFTKLEYESKFSCSLSFSAYCSYGPKEREIGNQILQFSPSNNYCGWFMKEIKDSDQEIIRILKTETYNKLANRFNGSFRIAATITTSDWCKIIPQQLPCTWKRTIQPKRRSETISIRADENGHWDSLYFLLGNFFDVFIDPNGASAILQRDSIVRITRKFNCMVVITANYSCFAPDGYSPIANLR